MRVPMPCSPYKPNGVRVYYGKPAVTDTAVAFAGHANVIKADLKGSDTIVHVIDTVSSIGVHAPGGGAVKPAMRALWLCCCPAPGAPWHSVDFVIAMQVMMP